MARNADGYVHHIPSNRIQHLPCEVAADCVDGCACTSYDRLDCGHRTALGLRAEDAKRRCLEQLRRSWLG